MDGLLLRPGPGRADHRLGAVRVAGRRCPATNSSKIDPELADNPLLFPDEETVARTYAFANLEEGVEAEYDARFAEITGA